MMYIFIFLALFLVIFFLSKELSKSLSIFFLHITRNQKTTIYLLSLFFLPGVIIHELAHMLTAGVLMVPVGNIELLPQIQGDSVKLGSVAIAKTDPIRRFFIGVAPVLVGIILLAGIYSVFFNWLQETISWQMLGFLWVVFQIGNTMFSSKKDMEGAIGFVLIAAAFFGLFFILGGRISIEVFFSLLSKPVLGFFKLLSLLLTVLACIDCFIIIGIRLLLKK